MTFLVLGIDPDLGGALAFLDRATGELVEVVDMPVLRIGARRELDVCELAGIVDDWAQKIGDAWIERATPRPVQGVVAAHVAGHTYGALVGVVRAHFIRLNVVSPATWKRTLKVHGDKDESRKQASLLYPAECRRWSAKGKHGRAEAVLIASYGRGLLRREAA